MSTNTEKFRGDKIIDDKNKRPLYAMTSGQQELLNSLDKNDIIFVNGPAGTGKTAVSTWYGIDKMDNGVYDHLVLTRPIVEAGEELGFLPGTFEEKVAPYMQPLYGAIEDIKGKQISPELAAKIEAEKKPISSYKKKKMSTNDFDNAQKKQRRNRTKSNEDFYSKVNVCPLAYLRGATKSKSFIILDEAQNVTKTQMKMMLTRIGKGSKLIICGDIDQSDLERRSDSGFREAQKVLNGVHGVGFVTLTEDDIVRHKLIKDIIIRYAKHDRKNHSGEVYNNRKSLTDNINDMGQYEFGDESVDELEEANVQLATASMEDYEVYDDFTG